MTVNGEKSFLGLDVISASTSRGHANQTYILIFGLLSIYLKALKFTVFSLSDHKFL